MKMQFVLILLVLLFHHHTLSAEVVSNPPPYLFTDIAVNCGCFSNSTALDGRRWIGESPLFFSKGKSKTSTSSNHKLFTADPVPYLTARISSSSFSYIFQVSAGQKIIRLHFLSASYRGFEKSQDLFNVKANSFTFLENWSPSLAANSLGIGYVVKEFCLNVNETGILHIDFSPSSKRSKRSNIHAFVNGIEIISMPTGLYFTPDDNLGVYVIGQRNGFIKIDNSTALELIQRLNIGGGSISAVKDSGNMFRRWSEDADYLLEYGFQQVANSLRSIESIYTPLPFIAPHQIYQTSRKMIENLHVDEQYHLTLKTPVDLGFGYMLRFHFCDLGDGSLKDPGDEFDITVQNIVAENRVNVIRWSGGYGIPVYKDYLVMMKGDRSEGRYDLIVSLHSASKKVGGHLKGLEIFKLSNANNSLASLYFPSSESDSKCRTPVTEIFAAAFCQTNVFMTVFTILFATVYIAVYMLRQQNLGGESWHKKAKRLIPIEPYCRYFSLAEMSLATNNFSDASVIGRGGFGQVYKGSINGCPEILAIKRSNPGSKQGEYEFLREIETLSKLRHIHLVSLIGYCNENDEMILVYEYMPRGTLADSLYKAKRKEKEGNHLTWKQRLRICIGAARGLDYLHTGTKHGVIHRDVKDTNILLDENFIAKISDFGLAELGRMDGTYSEFSTRVRGTIGYLDPDFLQNHTLSIKTDVYSFGIVLLVVLSGKPALERRLFTESRSLLSCYRACIKKGAINEIIDSCLQGEISTDSLTVFMEAIKSCLRKRPNKRPTMAQLIIHLEQALEKQQGLPPCISDDDTVISQSSNVESNRPFESFEFQFESEASARPSVLEKPSTSSTSYGYNLSGMHNMFRLRIYDFSLISSATNNFKLKPFSSSSSSTTWRCIMHNQEVLLIRRKLSCPIEILDLTKRFGSIQGVHHSSLVKLEGASISKSHIFLIYDYVHGGNLAECLRSRGTFLLLSSWMSRIKIATDIAHVLDYIHHSNGVSLNFVHNHIKSSSIIITPKLDVKLCHFGTTELCGEVIFNEKSDSIRSTCERTTGYMAPEFQVTGIATKKSDIYAFGMLILELLSGEDPLQVSLFEMGKRAVEGGDTGVRRWVDKRLMDYFPVRVAEKLALLGLECLSEDPDKRPEMRAVAAWISLLFLDSENWEEKMRSFFTPR